MMVKHCLNIYPTCEDAWERVSDVFCLFCFYVRLFKFRIILVDVVAKMLLIM